MAKKTRRDEFKKHTLGISISILLCILLGLIIWMNITISKMTESATAVNATYDHHYAMVVDNDDNPYWNLVFAGAMEEAVAENVVVEMVGTGLAEEYGLKDRLQMAIASKVDGIFVVPDGSDAVNATISDATGERNIPVISMMDNEAASRRSGYVGINSYEQGQAYGAFVETIAGQRAVHKVAILTRSAKDEQQADFSSGLIYSTIVEYLNNREKTRDIEAYMVSVNGASAFNSRRDIQIMLDSEDAPDIIICTDYQLTISTCQVVVEQNRVGKVQILGSYLSDDILNYIQKGTMHGTVAVDPYELGRVCVQGMTEIMDEGRTNDYMPLSMMTIDRKNVADYIEQYKEDTNE